MVVDAFTFNGEYDLFEIHYNILKDYVNEFIVLEFDKTFSGLDKPFYGLAGGPFYDPISFWPKVKYYAVGEDYYSKYKGLAESSPNTQGAEHWKREFVQKECLKNALIHLNDDDIVFIGDVDEVLDIDAIECFPNRPIKAELRVYTYWLNNSSSEQFWGTLIARYGDIKDECLNHLRANAHKREGLRGWHFTSMGGYNAVDKKLQDSYTSESYYSPWVAQNLEQNIADNKDFLGRDFTYRIDESEWPQYLKDHREKYVHLCKSTK